MRTDAVESEERSALEHANNDRPGAVLRVEDAIRTFSDFFIVKIIAAPAAVAIVDTWKGM